jgi:outer membrane protein W
MKRTTVLIPLILTLAAHGLAGPANFETRSTGLALKGSLWNVGSTRTSQVYVSGFDAETRVETGKAGGWICFFNRLAPNWMIELGLGGSGRANIVDDNWSSSQIEVNGVTPVVFGVQFYPFTSKTLRNLYPYLSLGGGPYWISNVKVEENVFGSKTRVGTYTVVKPGFYIGGGLHFMMSSWFGIGMDIRHHIIDMDLNDPDSGWEFGMGFEFFWGSFE